MPNNIAELNVAELMAEIAERDLLHKKSQRHLRALLNVLQDEEPAEEVTISSKEETESP